ELDLVAGAPTRVRPVAELITSSGVRGDPLAIDLGGNQGPDSCRPVHQVTEIGDRNRPAPATAHRAAALDGRRQRGGRPAQIFPAGPVELDVLIRLRLDDWFGGHGLPGRVR